MKIIKRLFKEIDELTSSDLKKFCKLNVVLLFGYAFLLIFVILLN